MAPPVAAATGEEQATNAEDAKAPLTGDKGGEVNIVPKSPTSKSEKKTVNGDAKPGSKAAQPSKDGELSGKDKKMKAKAEKMARRAQEKEKQKQQGQPVVDPPGTPKKTNRRGSNSAPKDAPKPQHKRAGSTGQKILPIRPPDSQNAQLPVEVTQPEKHVALFDHLYGSPRRTTLPGAGKDVHPAVLALGLQMSSYVVCGSNARCVSMLSAFKEVSPSSDILLLLKLTMYRRYHHIQHLHIHPSPAI